MADNFADENEEFEFRARAEQEAGQTDHSNIVQKSLAATVSSPFKLPPYKSRTSMPGSPFGDVAPAGLSSAVVGQPWSTQEQAKAKSGVDIANGAPLKLRNRLSLMVNPKDEDVKNAVNGFYGKDVGVTKNDMGDLEFTNPETGRRTLVNPRGTTVQNLIPTVGGTMDTALSTAGAIGGGLGAAVASGNPVVGAGGAVAGAMAGQTVSDIGKLTINSILGTGNKPTFDENVKDVASDAAKTGVATGIGELVGLGPAGVRWAGRGFLNLKYGKAVELQSQVAKATDDLQDYYKLIGEQKGINPNIPELLPQEGEIRMMHEEARRSGNALTAQEERRVNSNLDTLSDNYKVFSDSFKPSQDYQVGSSGYNMQGEFAAQKSAAQAQLMIKDSFAKANATRAAQGLPALTQTEMNQMSTDMLNTVENAGAQKVNQAYGDLKVALGVPKEAAYDRTSAQWLASRKTNDVMELNALTRTKIENMWKEGMALQSSPAKNGDKYFAAIPEDFYESVNHPENGLKDLRENKYDVLSVIDNIQDIHSGVRAAMRASRGQIQADDTAAAHVADMLEENVAWHLQTKGDPRILDAWENARQVNRQFNQDFRNGILNQVMTREGGFQSPVYTTSTSKLILSAGKGQDQSGVAKLAEVLKGDPNANENVRSMIWSVYREHYLPQDGIPTRASFNKFKDDLQGPMKYFFGEDDVAKMKTFEDLTDNLQDSAKKLKLFNQAWRASPEYGGIPANSQALADSVFRKNVPPQVLDKMIANLKSTRPDLLKEWQADTAARLAKDTSDASGMPIAAKLNAKINDLGDRVGKVMGPEYVANLRTLQKASTVALGSPGVRLDPDKPQSILTQAVRAAFAPPLSSEGRWYSGLLLWRKRAAGRVVYNALSSPEGLRNFVNTTRSNAMSPTAMGVLGNLNGRALSSSINNNAQQQAPQQVDNQ